MALPAMALASPSGVMGPKNAPNPTAQTAPAASFTSNGKTVALDTFKGHPVMLLAGRNLVRQLPGRIAHLRP
jgi:hypothetical protein